MDNGLTLAQVEESRKRYGSNQMESEKRKGFFSQFLSSFGDPIIKILLAALALNVLFMFRNFDWYEAIGIVIAIFLATFVSTISERGSESAFRELQKEAAKINCRVKREGQISLIPVGELVVGDIVCLQAGEKIPADGRLISGEMSVNQSALNGESNEARKRSGANMQKGTKDLMCESALFSGTVVCSGEGVMLVENIGSNTILGTIAMELQDETRESPLKVRLNKLAKTLSHLGYCAAILVGLADLINSFILDNNMQWDVILSQLTQPSLISTRVLHALTLAITTVIVAVPEGLPMMITIVLSSNMRRMLKDHVLVRKLVGIETSGSLNILFADKTGTLTSGKLSVSRVLTGDGVMYNDRGSLKRNQELWNIIELSCSKNSESNISGKKAIGSNMTDRALLSFVMPLSKENEGIKTGKHIPFDSERKFSAVELPYKNYTLIKGAPEKILNSCQRYIDKNGNIRQMSGQAEIKSGMREMTDGAMRVLALAISETPISGNTGFNNLIFVALIGIRDEVRKDAKKAVQTVQSSGVQVVMITGDNKETAIAIARECGLIRRNIDETVLTSDELSKIDDNELKRRLPRLRVISRALPSDKSRLVRVAGEMGLVTGMTGDGVNDAPALKRADVGFAMGSGTEVAKEAGDIVILNDSFSSITRAILYGRTIFKSIRKFIIFQLTMNLCAVGISIIGPFIGIDTPVTVVQMLWINIIMDTLAGLAFSGEAPLSEYMKEMPKRRDEPVLNRYMANQILCTGIFTIGLCIAFLKLPIFKEMFRYDQNPMYFMTAFFALFIFSGIFNSFNARTQRLNITSHLYNNKPFIFIMLLISVIQILLIYFGGSIFRTIGLTAVEFRNVIFLSMLVIPFDLFRKMVLRCFGRKGGV